MLIVGILKPEAPIFCEVIQLARGMVEFSVVGVILLLSFEI